MFPACLSLQEQRLGGRGPPELRQARPSCRTPALSRAGEALIRGLTAIALDCSGLILCFHKIVLQTRTLLSHIVQGDNTDLRKINMLTKK